MFFDPSVINQQDLACFRMCSLNSWLSSVGKNKSFREFDKKRQILLGRKLQGSGRRCISHTCTLTGKTILIRRATDFTKPLWLIRPSSKTQPKERYAAIGLSGVSGLGCILGIVPSVYSCHTSEEGLPASTFKLVILVDLIAPRTSLQDLHFRAVILVLSSQYSYSASTTFLLVLYLYSRLK